MTKISPIDFQPALVSTMISALEAATAHVDKSSVKNSERNAADPKNL
jgi:hypothetical protein